MGTKRPLRPEVANRYGEELSAVEMMKNNPNAYGNPNIKFDPLAEMKILQQENITDSSFMEASMQEWQQQGLPIPEFTAPQEPQAPTISPVLPEEDEDEIQDTIPTDPIERMKWAAEKLHEIDPKAPSANELFQWKQMHGNTFVLQLEDDVYIYRYIKRQEWAQMMANPAIAKMREEQVEDMIVEKCLLYPRLTPERKAFLPAGIVGLLASQIRIKSQFLDPMQVANITVKL